MIMDTAVLNQALLIAEGDIAACGGWEQPDYLFALRGNPCDPDLEYLLQIPGSLGEFLPTLLDLGLRTAPDIHGLMLAATAGEDLAFEDALEMPLMASMRRVCHQAGIGVDKVADHLRETWRLLRSQPHLARELQRPVRAVMGILADGVTSVVVRQDREAPVLARQLPELFGSHDDVVAMARRLMTPWPSSVSMPRRLRLLQATG